MNYVAINWVSEMRHWTEMNMNRFQRLSGHVVLDSRWYDTKDKSLESHNKQKPTNYRPPFQTCVYIYIYVYK